MKKLSCLLLLAVATILFVSCSKDSDSNDYYFRIYQDGAWKSYAVTAGEYGPDLADPTLFDMVLRGQNQNGTDLMDVTLQRSGSIPTGTYDTDNGVAYYADIHLLKVEGTNLFSWGVNDAPSLPPSKSMRATPLSPNVVIRLPSKS